MTPPVCLVQAAAEAMHRAHNDLLSLPCKVCEAEARIALAAAFTALPECEEAIDAVTFQASCGHICCSCKPSETLAALARDFGEPT